jgi:hypothetical protein
MTEPSTTTASPDEAVSQPSQWRYIVLALLLGSVVSLGGCALFLSQFNWSGGNSDTLRNLGTLGFLAGGVAFVGGVFWGVLYAIDQRRKRHRG